MQIKVDMRNLVKMLDRAKAATEDIAVDAYDYFKEKTPQRSGNARNKTRLSRDSIIANYPYAQRLDEGWSKQAPDGMVDPTIDHIEKVLVPRALRRAKNG